ncbi:hypothetical protein [Cumulibacter manganitolerans]|uniref:hypothetical protein n=1 Tax=Cumulibacter manganitolerans TaxID=1884992 RepID=UPI001886328B|nr:hypothetical protein [Cumulibacter manganitolerans]
MTSGRRFGARTLHRQPVATTLLAPERDVTSGSYVPGLRHDDKRHHDDDGTRHGADRGPRPPRSGRRTRGLLSAGRPGTPVLVAVAAAVVITAGVVVWATRDPAGPRAGAAAVTPSAGPVSDTSASAGAAPVTGSYSWTMVVTDGNANFPVGTSTSSTVSFQATCADPGCPISSPEYNGATFTFADGVYRAAFTLQEPCPGTAGVQVPDDVTVEIAPAGGSGGGPPERLTGTQTTISHSESCPTTISDPVTWSIDAVRTG